MGFVVIQSWHVPLLLMKRSCLVIMIWCEAAGELRRVWLSAVQSAAIGLAYDLPMTELPS